MHKSFLLTLFIIALTITLFRQEGNEQSNSYTQQTLHVFPRSLKCQTNESNYWIEKLRYKLNTLSAAFVFMFQCIFSPSFLSYSSYSYKSSFSSSFSSISLFLFFFYLFPFPFNFLNSTSFYIVFLFFLWVTLTLTFLPSRILR